MRILVSVLVFATLSIAAFAQEPRLPVEAIIQRLKTSEIKPGQFDQLPEATQNATIEALDELALNGDITAERTLVMLGDEQAVDRVVAKFQESYGKNRFNVQLIEQSQAPWLISRLEPYLMEDEQVKYRVVEEDFARRDDYGISWTSARLIKEITQNSPQIPSDVRNWAASIQTMPPDAFLANMRTWYAQNQEALESQDYSSLKVLKIEAQSTPQVQAQPDKLDSAIPAANNSDSQPEVQNSTQNASDPPDDAKKFPTMIVVIAVIVTALLALYFSKSKRS